MNPFRTGKIVLFQITYDRDWHFFEIIFFIVLGIFGVRYCDINSDSHTDLIHTGSLRRLRCKI
jgi:hypothetical protein